jgi:hypothetical protein
MSFFVRILANVATRSQPWPSARKLTLQSWHLLTRQIDYRWVRLSFPANKRRAMKQASGMP